MSPFNVLDLGIGLVLTCFGSTTVRAELQIDETFDKSELWTIGYNGSLKGCVASTNSEHRTTVWIGFDVSDPDIPAYLAFTNPNWRSIEPRLRTATCGRGAPNDAKWGIVLRKGLLL
jgi:hypothetical protein